MADNNTMLGMSLIAAGSALVGATAALLLVRKLQSAKPEPIVTDLASPAGGHYSQVR